MKFEYFHYKLNLKSPFRIASGERNHTDLVLVKLSYKDFIGFGEASLPPYFKENVQSVFSFFEKIDLSRLKIELSINEVLEYVDGIDKGNNAAKAAIDIAIHDLKGKIENKTIYELYGIKRPKNIYTSLTIGISSLNELEQKLENRSEITLFKLKLGGVNDKDTVTCYVATALQKAMDAGAIGESERNGLDMAMDAVSRILDRYIASSNNGKLDEVNNNKEMGEKICFFSSATKLNAWKSELG